MRQGREGIRRSRELKPFELVYSLSPKAFHRVVVEGCVRADDGNLFDYRQRNDEPVKRVAMMKRQRRQRCCLAGLDGQNQKTVLNNAPIKERLKRLVQLIFADADLLANSQYTAGLISLVFADSSIRLRAVELSCASPSTN